MWASNDNREAFIRFWEHGELVRIYHVRVDGIYLDFFAFSQIFIEIFRKSNINATPVRIIAYPKSIAIATSVLALMVWNVRFTSPVIRLAIRKIASPFRLYALRILLVALWPSRISLVISVALYTFGKAKVSIVQNNVICVQLNADTHKT